MTLSSYKEIYVYSPEEALRLAWYQKLSNVGTRRSDLRDRLLNDLAENRLGSFNTERTRLLDEEDAQAGFFWTPSLSWFGSFLSWLTGFRILQGSRLREALLIPPSLEKRQLSQLPDNHGNTIPEPDSQHPAFHEHGFKTAVFSNPEEALADFLRRLESAQNRQETDSQDFNYQQLLKDFVCLRQRLSPLLYQTLWRQLFAIDKRAAYEFFFRQLAKPCDRDGYDYNQIIKTDLCEYLCESQLDNQGQASMKDQHAENILLALIMRQEPLASPHVDLTNKPLMDWLDKTLGAARVKELSTPPRASCSGLNPLLDTSTLLQAAIEAYKKDPNHPHPLFLSFCKIAANRLAEHALLTQELSDRTSKLIHLGVIETEQNIQTQAFRLYRQGMHYTATNNTVSLGDLADQNAQVNAKRFHNAVTIDRAYHIATQIIIAWTKELQNPLESTVRDPLTPEIKSPVERFLSDAEAEYHNVLQNEAIYEQVLGLLSAYHERLKKVENIQYVMPRITARFALIKSRLQDIKATPTVKTTAAIAEEVADQALEDEEPVSTATAGAQARTAPASIARSLYSLFGSCLGLGEVAEKEDEIRLVPVVRIPGNPGS